ncbi:MAG: exodeoxyribonuclease VII small subunit [Clostridia bacterium]|nr:exodeoxyribonuclease VII small subunit [Clostridia bacterium]
MAAKKTFEESMNELEAIVEALEKGDCPLDEAVKLFEKGVKISNECHKRLNDAEQKIKILTETDISGAVLEE